MNNPYQGNHFWEEMEPGYLIPGHLYTLVINEKPESLAVVSPPEIQTNMVFIRHDMHPHDPDMHVLIFRFENQNDTAYIVKNTPKNKYYRLKRLSEDIQPGSPGWLFLNRGGITDPHMRSVLFGQYGGKRKNNKKKTHRKKKTAGKKTKSLRKRKSLKKNKKNKKN
jgi:hypothetical protein